MARLLVLVKMLRRGKLEPVQRLQEPVEPVHFELERELERDDLMPAAPRSE